MIMWFNAKHKFLYFIDVETLDEKSEALYRNHLHHKDGPIGLPFPSVK